MESCPCRLPRRQLRKNGATLLGGGPLAGQSSRVLKKLGLGLWGGYERDKTEVKWIMGLETSEKF